MITREQYQEMERRLKNHQRKSVNNRLNPDELNVCGSPFWDTPEAAATDNANRTATREVAAVTTGGGHYSITHRQCWPMRTECDGGGSEKSLHNMILNTCHNLRWPVLHGSMAHKTRRTLGEPDFVVLAPGGRVLFIECKRMGEVLSEPQQEFSLNAASLGHQVHVIKSYQDWQKLLAALGVELTVPLSGVVQGIDFVAKEQADHDNNPLPELPPA